MINLKAGEYLTVDEFEAIKKLLGKVETPSFLDITKNALDISLTKSLSSYVVNRKIWINNDVTITNENLDQGIEDFLESISLVPGEEKIIDFAEGEVLTHKKINIIQKNGFSAFSKEIADFYGISLKKFHIFVSQQIVTSKKDNSIDPKDQEDEEPGRWFSIKGFKHPQEVKPEPKLEGHVESVIDQVRKFITNFIEKEMNEKINLELEAFTNNMEMLNLLIKYQTKNTT